MQVVGRQLKLMVELRNGLVHPIQLVKFHMESTTIMGWGWNICETFSVEEMELKGSSQKRNETWIVLHVSIPSMLWIFVCQGFMFGWGAYVQISSFHLGAYVQVSGSCFGAMFCWCFEFLQVLSFLLFWCLHVLGGLGLLGLGFEFQDYFQGWSFGLMFGA
jgi:hypothetical protein